MTNEQRRAALNRARAKSLEHAEQAEAAYDGTSRAGHGEMAKMWAAVADAMKDGDPVHDGPDGADAAPPSTNSAPS